jgi:GT2 family glycosyltransferase
MSFSAVIATSASPSRTKRLLEVIDVISRSDLLQEIIVVWQSTAPPGRGFDNPKLKLFFCPVRAVSVARNQGAFKAKGDWIWFLDDDTMPASESYLDRAKQILDARRLDFLTSNVCGEGAGQVCARASRDVPIDNRTVWSNFWEPGVIVAREAFRRVPYDVHLGPGCLHGSSEGADLGIRLVRAGYKGMRAHELELEHPRIARTADSRNKLFIYALGNGLVELQQGGLGKYSRSLLKTGVKAAAMLLTLRFSASLDLFLRLCGLLAGPHLKPALPFNIEPGLLDREDLLIPLRPSPEESVPHPM